MATSNDLTDVRQEYRLAELSRTSVAAEPVAQFAEWMDQARRADVPEPNAMTVATVDTDGQADARVLLLKEFDAKGFVFYTNYSSAKGLQWAQNPSAAMVFLWLPLERQVRIRGTVERVGAEQSEAYFQSRPRGSQIGAAASEQSQTVENRAVLETRFEQLERQYQDQPVSMPENWGGYRLVPVSVEFWQGRSSRLHDRLRYRRVDGVWILERLQP